MENSGLSASDVLALTRDNNDNFGGVGGFVLLFIFLMAISGNGFGWGNNGTATALGQSDLQNSLYFQSQDGAIRNLSSNVAMVNDSILSSKYDSALLMKDASQQLSNSIAGIGNLIVQENQATRNMLMQNKIEGLADQITILRGENSNLRQTAQITENILSNLSTTAPKPPCYYPYCNCQSTTTGTTTNG